MKGFGKRFGSLFRLLTLLLAVAALGWLFRSYFRDDVITFAHTYVHRDSTIRLEIQADVNKGRLVLMPSKETTPRSSNEAAELYLEGVHRYEPREPLFKWEVMWPDGLGVTTEGIGPLGFQWWRSSYVGLQPSEVSQPSAGYACLLGMPIWSLALLLSVPATLNVVVTRRRLRRLKAGRCASCGYDLRATPGRCPECGAAVQTA